jgi:hypothetical protein
VCGGDARLYRAFTIISDSAIVVGALALVLAAVTATRLPWLAPASPVSS